MHALPNPDLLVDSSIAWFYLIANSMRGFTYLPQIVAVWRSRDGAQSLSLLTWGSWLVAHVAAILYGWVLNDAFFTSISVINCTGCAAVTAIAARRRRQSHAALRKDSTVPRFDTASRASQRTRASGSSADAYLDRWGYGRRWVATNETPTKRN